MDHLGRLLRKYPCTFIKAWALEPQSDLGPVEIMLVRTTVSLIAPVADKDNPDIIISIYWSTQSSRGHEHIPVNCYGVDRMHFTQR